MKVYDISMTVSPEIMTYKNLPEKKPIFENQSNFDNGSHYETKVTYNLHTGTHVDAPLHMVEDGATMESYDIGRFITPCRVLDLTHVRGMVHKDDLKGFDIQPGDFLLLKTKNSWDTAFDFDFVSLAEDGAIYLKELGVDGVGIDALGIERSQPSHMTHISLLGQGIIILEGLQLKEVPEGKYQLIALPIKLAGVEAAPVRAVLIDD
jgi:arylformamidase